MASPSITAVASPGVTTAASPVGAAVTGLTGRGFTVIGGEVIVVGTVTVTGTVIGTVTGTVVGTVTTPGPPASDGLLTCRVKRWITSATTGAAEACSPDDDGTSGVRSSTSIASLSAATSSAVSISV